MFNILHISDVHLGAVPYGMRERGLDIDRCLTFLAGSVVEVDRWDAIILAGDTFDQAQINPMDHQSLRALLAMATQRQIPIYWIEGDHDSMRRDRVRRDARTWPESFQENFFVCPEQLGEDGLPRLYTLEKEDHRPITICPINWRPTAQIRELLSGIPNGYCDLMILHQSLEGVIPAIGNPELELEHLDGKAAHFAMGDLHVDHATTLPSGAVAAYPGPLEWLATDQAPHAGYRWITFNEEGSWRNSTHSSSNSRKLVNIQITQHALIDLVALMPGEAWGVPEFVEVGSPGNSVRIQGSSSLFEGLRHRYFFDLRYFNSTTGDNKSVAESVKNHLEYNFPGCLVRIKQIASVDPAQAYTEDSDEEFYSNSSSLSMEEAIRQHCAEEEDPAILQTALDIWSHPENVKNILENQNETEEAQDS